MDNRDIFGLNSGDNHDYPAQNRPRPELTDEEAAKILAVLAEDEDEKEEEEPRRIKDNEEEKTKISV